MYKTGVDQQQTLEMGSQIDYLGQFVFDDKMMRMDKVLDLRTRYLTVVIENLYHPHNASAVLRSSECFGIQDIHIIENENKFKPNTGVTRDCHKWLTLNRYAESNAHYQCFSGLRKKGYRLIAASPHETSVSLSDLALDQKTAIVFGSEKFGLSQEAMETVDGFVHIPMVGFSESLNISVAAAIGLSHLSNRLRESSVLWGLSDLEKLQLKHLWMQKSVRSGDQLLKKYFEAKA